MQTITFYSYNGGTGRTLAVANAAKHLVRLGQKVFAIDLDLEAPGLHYKLGLGTKSTLPQIQRGLVDYMHTFFGTKSHPPLSDYTVQIGMDDGPNDFITLMPAGNVPCAEYWRKLTQIDWHKLFYSEAPEGIPFFLELKARIEKDFAPDFLLIDSRTGITEIGGIATTVLPDSVVCLLLRNKQNLEGSRAVLQGILSAKRFDNKPPIAVIPVLSRVRWASKRRSSEFEDNALEEVRAELCGSSAGHASISPDQEILLLHTDGSLEIEERLLVGGKRAFDQSPLLRDYLRLFSKLIPPETVAPHLEKLINASMAEIIDRPEKVQNDLETIVEQCPHEKSFLALLKYYRVRQAGAAKLLRAAAGYWELSRDSGSTLLWEVISEHFHVDEGERAGRPGEISPEFVEAVWADAGAFDLKVGLRLADFYFKYRDVDAAINLLMRMIENVQPNVAAIVASVRKLVSRDQLKVASELVDKYRAELVVEPDFQVVWARLIIGKGDSTQAKELVESKAFRPAKLQADDPLLYVQLLSLAGQTEELAAALRNALEQVLVERDLSPSLLEIGALFFEAGKQDVFKRRLHEVFPRPMAEQAFTMASRRVRSLGFKSDLQSQ